MISNIVIGGNDSARNVTVTPAFNQSGTALVTLTVDNHQPSANTADISFLVTIQSSLAGDWRQQYFHTTSNTGDSADAADPDGDSVSNLMERFLGSNPRSADSGEILPRGKAEGENFMFTFTRSLLATDLLYQVQSSPDLISWTDLSDNHVTTSGTSEIRMASVPMNPTAPLFLRLQVVAP